MDGLQQRGDAGRILGPDPVEFETVAHRHHDLGAVFGHQARERADPGVELLFWDFPGQPVHAGLPEGLDVGGQGGWGGALDHAGDGGCAVVVDK
ncbi:hypothetical protein FQZ97_874670 [compost metagenome]